MSKGYLCMDLKDSKGKVKTCYLMYDDIEKLIRFTSYCSCFEMFVNILTKDNKINIKELIRYRLGDTKLYYKKSKDGNKLDVVYSNDDDIFYADVKDAYEFLKRVDFIGYNGHFPSGENARKMYEFLSSIITSDNIKRRIMLNFNENYDYDKNPENIKYQKCEFYEKIALVNDNIVEVLNYIFSDPYKKVLFLKYLKSLTNKNVVSNEKLEANKNRMNYKISRSGYNPRKMINIINDSILSFLRINNKQNNEDNKTKKEEYKLENDDDYLERYQRMIEDPNVDPDLKDDLILYIDAQKEALRKNKLS